MQNGGSGGFGLVEEGKTKQHTHTALPWSGKLNTQNRDASSENTHKITQLHQQLFHLSED